MSVRTITQIDQDPDRTLGFPVLSNNGRQIAEMLLRLEQGIKARASDSDVVGMFLNGKRHRHPLIGETARAQK